MKARVKATGDIVDATYWHTAGDGVKYYDIDKSGYTMTEDELDFDFSYTPNYWTRLEHQYVGMAMQGILSNPEYLRSLMHTKHDDYEVHEVVPNIAVRLSHALVEKLKEKRK